MQLLQLVGELAGRGAFPAGAGAGGTAGEDRAAHDQTFGAP